MVMKQYKTVMRENGVLERVEVGGNDSTPVIDISDLTDEQLRAECKESLVAMMRANKGKIGALGAIKEILDRMDGKPAQSVSMTVKRDPVGELTADQLAAILAQLPNNPIIIPPMPKRE